MKLMKGETRNLIWLDRQKKGEHEKTRTKELKSNRQQKQRSARRGTMRKQESEEK